MPEHLRRADGSRSAQFAERLILVAAWLSRKTEDTLGQGVALDIVGSATQSRRPLVQEGRLPEPVVEGGVIGQHAVGADEAHEQVPVQTHVLGEEQFRGGRFWTRKTTLGKCRLHAVIHFPKDPPPGKELGDLSPRQRIRAPATTASQVQY